MRFQMMCRWLAAALAGGVLLQTSTSCQAQFMDAMVSSLSSSLSSAIESSISSYMNDWLAVS